MLFTCNHSSRKRGVYLEYNLLLVLPLFVKAAVVAAAAAVVEAAAAAVVCADDFEVEEPSFEVPR